MLLLQLTRATTVMSSPSSSSPPPLTRLAIDWITRLDDEVRLQQYLDNSQYRMAKESVVTGSDSNQQPRMGTNASAFPGLLLFDCLDKMGDADSQHGLQLSVDRALTLNRIWKMEIFGYFNSPYIWLHLLLVTGPGDYSEPANITLMELIPYLTNFPDQIRLSIGMTRAIGSHPGYRQEHIDALATWTYPCQEALPAFVPLIIELDGMVLQRSFNAIAYMTALKNITNLFCIQIYEEDSIFIDPQLINQYILFLGPENVYLNAPLPIKEMLNVLTPIEFANDAPAEVHGLERLLRIVWIQCGILFCFELFNYSLLMIELNE